MLTKTNDAPILRLLEHTPFGRITVKLNNGDTIKAEYVPEPVTDVERGESVVYPDADSNVLIHKHVTRYKPQGSDDADPALYAPLTVQSVPFHAISRITHQERDYRLI
ncbi:hypothetical protein P0E63_13680, partial [Enterococcus faecalis]|uniref:hypothetical protein n=1 Tax=Enterococcus faecalis TaxID=1351 RepID=UPI0025B222B2